MVPNGNAKTVLVIEDEEDIRHLVVRLLQLEKYQVHQASDGESGLRMLEGGNSFDLLLLDLTLPGMDGWAVLKIIKQHPRLSSMPVVIFSAMADITSREEALKLGASDYLVKPVSALDLRDAISRIFN